MRRSRESAPMRALLVLTALQAYWSVRADATPMQLDPLVNALGRLLGRNWNDEIDRPDPLPQALRLLAAHIEIDQRFCRGGSVADIGRRGLRNLGAPVASTV